MTTKTTSDDTLVKKTVEIVLFILARFVWIILITTVSSDDKLVEKS